MNIHRVAKGATKVMGSANDALRAAVSGMKGGERVWVHGTSATPSTLVKALSEVVPESFTANPLRPTHLHVQGPVPYATDPRFRAQSLFTGANMRDPIAQCTAEYVPCFLSDIPSMIMNKTLEIDTALVHVSPPDRHGFCSLGTSVEATPAAIKTARVVVAQVNKHMPRTFGDATLHVSNIDYMVDAHAPLGEHKPEEVTPAMEVIGKLIADNLVEDESILQMGIGGIPDATLRYLTGHKRLGIHTEMFSDGLLPLIESGVVTNETKDYWRYKLVSTFVNGTQKLFDWVDDNPMIELLTSNKTNGVGNIMRMSKMTAINSCIEVDLTGQVVSDSIGSRIYSGIGGQVDFIRGAQLAPHGKAVLAMSSCTTRGDSKIVPFLKQGGGVVTTRGHVQYVVTEFGIVNLQGKSLQDRAKLLISVAHPKHREMLEKEFHARFK
jgi:4-hydroxybutyrate CoA-transferase